MVTIALSPNVLVVGARWKVLITRSLLPVAYLGSGLLLEQVLRPGLSPGGSWDLPGLVTVLGDEQVAAEQLVFLLAGLALVALAGGGSRSRRLCGLDRGAPA